MKKIALDREIKIEFFEELRWRTNLKKKKYELLKDDFYIGLEFYSPNDKNNEVVRLTTFLGILVMFDFNIFSLAS